MWFAIYCFVSAVIFFALGIVWDKSDPVQTAIKWLFWFLGVWGVFFGMLLWKELV